MTTFGQLQRLHAASQAAWFGIAREVNRLLALSGAWARFKEEVETVAAKWTTESDPPLPVPHREVSIGEKYAVLAAVWDGLWRGERKIGPWSARKPHEEGYGYMFLAYDLLGPPKSPFSTCIPTQDAEIARTWVAEVEVDLGVRQLASKRRWTQAEVDELVSKEVAQYRTLIASAREGSVTSKQEVCKKLGRNAIANRLQCASKMVGKASGWRLLAKEFGMERPTSGKSHGLRGTKVGMHIAEEQAAVDTTRADVSVRELTGLFAETRRKISESYMKADKTVALKALDDVQTKFNCGEIPPDRVHDLISTILAQLGDDASDKVH